ncbi:hypothetical protein XENOCAPTIV_004487, partial [Xenoophorus captivus]
LRPYTAYLFEVSAFTSDGEGQVASTMVRMPESVLEVSYQNISSTSILVNWVPPLYPNGRITHYSVYKPDSPPENLSVLETSPTTATLTWSAPEKANGVIQYYEVFYENQSYSALTNSTSNRVTLISLKPFSFYNVSVRAYTRYGNGNQTSETLYLLSGEDGVLKNV